MVVEEETDFKKRLEEAAVRRSPMDVALIQHGGAFPHDESRTGSAPARFH